jgi:hypothetical protein
LSILLLLMFQCTCLLWFLLVLLFYLIVLICRGGLACSLVLVLVVYLLRKVQVALLFLV